MAEHYDIDQRVHVDGRHGGSGARQGEGTGRTNDRSEASASVAGADRVGPLLAEAV